jgi:F-type H+-transporting ATPase subunit gamma
LATLNEIKNRIIAVKSTQKITKAMKMVAAAKLRRAQDKIISARPYAMKMNELLQHLLKVADSSINSLIQPGDISTVLLVVVTSDRGLCGSFNSNIIKNAVNYINTSGKKVKLITIGKKCSDFFVKRNYDVKKSLNIGHLSHEILNDTVQEIIKGYLAGEYQSVELIYNEFISIAKQNLIVDKFLPLKVETTEKSKKSGIDYIYEPSSVLILNDLIPKQLNVHFRKSILESNASEMAARMTAMETATNNASDLIRFLELGYNRARQESITNELLEIVSGAEALKESV